METVLSVEARVQRAEITCWPFTDLIRIPGQGYKRSSQRMEDPIFAHKLLPNFGARIINALLKLEPKMEGQPSNLSDTVVSIAAAKERREDCLGVEGRSNLLLA